MKDQSMQLPGFPRDEVGSAKGSDRGWSVTFWGTGDSMGVPRVYCACQVCEEARKEGVNRRYRSSCFSNGAKTGCSLIAGRTGRGRWREQGCSGWMIS